MLERIVSDIAYNLSRKICHGITKNIKLIVPLLIGLSAVSSAHAFIYPAMKYGYVYSRSLVLGPSEKPIFIEYNDDGTPGTEFGEAVGELDGASIMAVGVYKQYTERYRQFKAETTGPAKNAYLLTAEAYRSTEFTTVNDTPINKPPLNGSTLYVLVRAKETLVSPDDSPVLMEAPINLEQYRTYDGATAAKSILLKKDGTVFADSTLNIGLKADFWKDEADRKNNKYLGPMPGVIIEGPAFTLGGGAITDSKGKYTMSYLLPPCPGFFFEYNAPVVARLYYKNFNPRAQSLGLYYQYRDSYDFCNGLGDVPIGFSLTALMVQLEMQAIKLSSAVAYPRVDFPIDVIALTGRAHLASQNELVPVGGVTEHSYDRPNFEAITYEVDYDGDGTNDNAVRGRDETDAEGKTTFVADPEGELMGIYLSSGSRSPDSANEQLRQPDFKRIVDKTPDFQDQGLLSAISTADLRKTDVYLFRESNGMLITERIGLKPEELNRGGIDGNKVYYNIMVRGPKDTGLGYQRFEEMQSRALMVPSLQRRKADHIRPGEKVKIVLINRSTGYIGTLTTELLSSKDRIEGMISFPISEIVMRPPNLKVQVKRRFDVKDGLTGGKERNNLIGFEGGALSSDTSVEVTTEWYDFDGTALPEGLGEHGLTGRLSIIVNPNELYPVGGILANFSIRPGTHKEILKLRDPTLEREHFYLHVSGTPKDRSPGPDFQTTASEGNFAHRPRDFVPFKVAIYDEQASLIQKKLWQDAKKAGNSVGEKPAPLYRWLYRPEMQFSSFELAVEEMTRGNEYDQRTSMLGSKNPGVSDSDSFISIIYTLLANKCDVLAPFGPEREMIFAIGQDEVKAELDSHRQLNFTNLEHLAALEPEDFLSMRLYLNNDPENALWEYAFDMLLMTPNKKAEQIEVSADNPEIAFTTIIAGYTERAPEDKHPYTLRWKSTNSNATFSEVAQTNSDGIFKSTITMPRQKGERARVTAVVGGDDDNVSATGPDLIVVPGKPARFEVRANGTTAIGGLGEVTLEATLKDNWGNLVSDGTPVSVETDGDVELVADSETVNGVVKVKVKGETKPGSKQIKFKAGDAESQQTIDVANVELSIQVASSVVAGNKLPVTITATSSAGVDLEGATISLGAYRGRMSEYEVVLSGGQASVEFQASTYAGEGLVQASFAGSSTTKSVEVQAASDDIELDVPVVIGDRASGGAVDIDTGEGNLSVPYATEAKLTITGAPGTTKTVRIGSLSNPAITPLVEYSFSNLGSTGEVQDISGTVDATAESISVSREGMNGFSGSFEFRNDSKVVIPASNLLERETGLGISLKFNPWDLGGTLVDFSQSGQMLTLSSDGRVEFRIETIDGVFQVQSAPILQNRWHSVAARYDGALVLLEIDGARVTAPAHGALKKIGNGAQIGGAFVGLMQEFRIVDWAAPALATLSNGQQEIEVTLDSNGRAEVPIQGANAMSRGSQLVTSLKASSGLFRTAYAAREGTRGQDWNGDIYVGDKNTPLGIVSEGSFKTNAGLAFLNGMLTGDTSSGAAIAGDIVMGAIPFGDSRDILIQSWNLASKNGEYKNSVYILAWIGLAVDAAAVTGVGEVLNAAVAGAKTAMKVFAGLPFDAALAKYLIKVADAVKVKDFSKLEKMLPFMQLLAAIVIDDELRALMGTAIMTAADVNVWVEYLDELEKALDRGVTDEVTYIQEPAEEGEEGDDENTEFPPPPLPSERQCSCDNARDESERYANDWPRELIESAYAAGTSPFKQYLKDLVTKGVLRRGEDATALIALVRTMPEGMKYSKKVIDAVAKVIEIGGAELGHSVAKFKKLSTATHGMTPAKLVDIINAIDLSKMGDEAKVGLQKVLKELSESDNKAIGAAFQLHAIKELQEKGYKITKIEPWTEMKAGNRYVDIVAEIGGETVRIETKSWDPAYVDKYIKKYLHGDGLNPQLYIDLVQKQQQGGKGIKWLLNAEVPAETARKAAYDTIVGNHDLLQKFKNQFGMDEIADVKDEIGRLLTDLFENVG